MNTTVHTKQKQSGFTIVELLIVIVVIGILAAIVIVSYSGITNRANEVSIKARADSVIDKASTYNALTSTYPVTDTDLSADPTEPWYVVLASDVYYAPSGPSAMPQNVLSASSSAKILVLKCHSSTPTNGVNDQQSLIDGSNITGLQVWYYNPQTASRENVVTGTAYAGTGTAWSTAYCPQQ